MKFGIIITTFNRFEYVKRMLESFKRTIFPEGTVVYINDDGSTDTELKKYIFGYHIENNNVILKKHLNQQNIGSKRNYVESVLRLEKEEIDFVINLDSDCVLNPKWLLKIKQIINNFGDNIICSSFFCRHHIGNPSNRLIPLKDEYYERDTLNGLGICFPSRYIEDFKIESDLHFDSFLAQVIKPKYNLKCICTNVSYIQHIGIKGVNSNPHSFDAAELFIGE